jgi:hypothetical protein
VDLLVGPDGLDMKFSVERDQQRSGSGMIETISHYHIIEGYFDAYFTESVYRDLLAWWAWAGAGQPWSFAMNTDEDSSTTLDGSAAAAQKVIPVTDTTGFTAGDVCLIRSADRFTFEVVVIDSVSSGVSVTAVANLKNAYVSGAGFRHLEYFPNAISLDDDFRPKKRGAYYSHTFHFLEEVDTMTTARRVGTGSWGTPATVTLSGGVAALAGPGYYLIAVESGSTDDLDQITGLSNGDEVILGPADGAKDVVVKHGTYIKLNAETDFALDGAYDTIRLLCVGSNTCKELGSASND